MSVLRLHCFLAVALFAAAAGAEPDDLVAPPLRWYDARGTASGSRRSAALPVTTEPEEFWHAVTRLPIVSTPVTWDGRVYLLCSGESESELVSLDLFRGIVIAGSTFRSPRHSQLAVWAHRVYLRISDTEIGEYVVAHGSFERSFQYRVPGPGFDPLVFHNEIYLVGQEYCQRFAVGHSTPLWSANIPCDVRVRPLLRGPQLILPTWDVYETSFSLNVATVRRQDGQVEMRFPLFQGFDTKGTTLQAEGEPEAVLSPARLYFRLPLRLPGGPGMRFEFASLPYDESDYSNWGLMRPALHRIEGGSCASHRHGLVARTLHANGRSLVLFRRKDRDPILREVFEDAIVLAREWEQPDLFTSRVAPTVLGDVVYFGNWAADVVTLEILWRLPRGEVRFPVVPADRMFLVVDGSNSLRAYRQPRGPQ